MLYCPKCGIELRDGAESCQECASPVVVTETQTESVTPAAAAEKEAGSDPRGPEEKDDTTISSLLDSLADGSFKKASPPPSSMRLVLIAAAILCLVVSAALGGYWYSKHRAPVDVDRVDVLRASKKPVDEVVAPFIMERGTTPQAEVQPPVKHVVKQKTKKKRNVEAASKVTVPGEKKPAADNYVSKERPGSQKKLKADDGQWFNKPPSGPDVSPPSMDPRETCL